MQIMKHTTLYSSDLMFVLHDEYSDTSLQSQLQLYKKYKQRLDLLSTASVIDSANILR